MLYKYPRTYHLPWSLGSTSDDKILSSVNQFVGKEVVVTVKMDGENTSIYKDHIHARSLDSKNHVSRNWLKNFAQNFQQDIPEEYRLCGENLFAKHSIHYKNLKSYFYLFSVWNKEICLDWDSTIEWASLLGVEVVPVIYRGLWDEKIIRDLYSEKFLDNEMEGYVVRSTDSFSIDDFSTNVAKFVRKNHVQTEDHWMNQEIIRNEIKKEE